ncbi:hypothetical protein C8F01DRAFT_1077958 [Mycena amicta]|nr:hypothetical protein C8F01DRAFT_1077958 [Mycena amicta]
MHPVLKAQLRRDFPRLFRYFDVEFSISNGWESLLRWLCNAIQHDPNVAFSGLRAYNGGATRDTRDKQYKVQEESFLICKRCREDGRLATRGGWIFTSCQECMDVYNADGLFTYLFVNRHIESV